MRGLRAFLRQSFVMEFARGFGIAAEIELIFPSEIQTRLRKSTAERHTIDRVIGDAAENPASVMPINKLFPFSEDSPGFGRETGQVSPLIIPTRVQTKITEIWRTTFDFVEHFLRERFYTGRPGRWGRIS